MSSALRLFSASLVLLTSLAIAQVEESHVDFTLAPALLESGKVQVAYEWLEPAELKTKEMAITDVPKVASLHPDKNHTVAAKLAFVANRSFEELSHSAMNTKGFISKMLHAVTISQKTDDTWAVSNRVKAYSIPFRISFDFRFRETNAASISTAANYLKEEAASVAGKGRERFMILDMTNFSQLMYRNYSIVYMKELGPKKTLVVSTVVAGFNKNMADKIFNLPPINTTEKTMMANFRMQIMHMVREIQN
jgi:hypothetical protein